MKIIDRRTARVVLSNTAGTPFLLFSAADMKFDEATKRFKVDMTKVQNVKTEAAEPTTVDVPAGYHIAWEDGLSGSCKKIDGTSVATATIITINGPAYPTATATVDPLQQGDVFVIDLTV